MRGRELPPQYPDQACGTSSLLLNACLGLSPEEDDSWNKKLVIHLHLVMKLRTCGATTPLSLTS